MEFLLQDEYEEQVRGVENAYEALKHSYVQLEVRTMELQSQLAMANRMHSHAGMNRSGSSSSMMQGHKSSIQRKRGSTSANVDIELPATIMTSGGSSGLDRSFMVGSPPSSNGSIGSDKSEVIRRALEMGGIVQDGFLQEGENRSPEVGSAVSAREAFAVAGSNSSSVNGAGAGFILK